MADYTQIFVAPVRSDRIAEYRKQAELYIQVLKDHGALSSMELEADDAPMGKVTSFPQSVALQPGETVFLGMSTFRSKAHRDEVMAKMMQDPRLTGMDPAKMAFDMKRMFWGGFKPFVAG